MWWLIGWVYDFFVSNMDNEKRKEFDDRLDYIRHYDERKAQERQQRIQEVQEMLANQR